MIIKTKNTLKNYWPKHLPPNKNPEAPLFPKPIPLHLYKNLLVKTPASE